MKEFLLATNWNGFLPSMIATFIGFVLALLGQWGFGHIKEYKASKQLKERIARELVRIKSDLEVFVSIALDVHPLKTPVWNAAINAGQISLLAGKNREQLFLVYNAIQEFNSWCLVQTNYYFEKGRYNDLLTNELHNLKAELLNDEYSEFGRSIVDILRNLDMNQKEKK